MPRLSPKSVAYRIVLLVVGSARSESCQRMPPVQPLALMATIGYYEAVEGQRMEMTTESSSACQEWSVPGPHVT
jgi:hypothetical protein